MRPRIIVFIQVQTDFKQFIFIEYPYLEFSGTDILVNTIKILNLCSSELKYSKYIVNSRGIFRKNIVSSTATKICFIYRSAEKFFASCSSTDIDCAQFHGRIL